jgi:hypothetical protein
MASVQVFRSIAWMEMPLRGGKFAMDIESLILMMRVDMSADVSGRAQ